ncbi:hypothetical protein GCM10027594_10930 [Hymenobacter agri]
MSDARQLISEIHGATIEAEFERVAAKVQARFPNTSNSIEVLSILQPELTFAKRLVAQWKSDFPKGSRPPQYQAKKELVALLEQEIAFWQEKTHPSEPVAEANKPKAVDAPKLSLRQVALLYIYKRQHIPNSGANAIARANGHTSGEKLYKHYNNLSKNENRTCIDGRALQPLIKDVQAVLPWLSGQQKEYVESELKTLKSKIIDRS